MIPAELTQAQFDTVYNFLSLVIAAQLFTTIFLLASQRRVLPRYRQALVMSAIVCGIAAYHYFRIFDSFKSAFVTEAKGGRGMYEMAAGHSFNEGYRYVDWLLTVPLLLAELIVVLALARKLQNSLLVRLIPASALMIALGYPGEISGDNFTRNVWGLLSTIPFLYIL
ncbi:MAG: bacteriorhodopsin, partial [Mycobacterium sp.]